MSARTLLGAVFVLAAVTSPVFAETFDISTFTPPAGWGASSTKGVITYTTVDQRAGTFCRIAVYESTKATKDAKADFAADWRLIVQPMFKGVGAPTLSPPSKSDDGWDITVGGTQVPFGGKPTTVIQIMASKAGVRVPLLYTATSDCSAQLDAFTNSITFGTPAAAPAAAASDTWTAVPKADWVEVTSSAGKVLIHYPNAKADAYDSVLKNSDATAWNTLVAPHYTNMRNFANRSIQSFESVTFVEAEMTEKETNRNVYVVLFRLHDGKSRYLELVSDSKAAFERTWGAHRQREFGWDTIKAMGNYDRFTITPATIAGTWSSTSYAGISYYYVSSGRAAGADATSLAHSFVFDAKGGYSSDYAGASGPVGQAKFARVQYKGKYTIDKGVQLTLTNRFQGKPETFTAYFQAVKNGNILVLVDARNSVTYLGKNP